jgi:hypothetical protein
MNKQMSERIDKHTGVSALAQILSEKLSGSDLHSLLLSVFKNRIDSSELSSLAQPSAVTKSCDLDGRLLNKVESIGYEIASDVEVLELSPLAPLGAVAMLTGLDQANVLSTIRAYECASDPTIGLALECACRRKNPASRKSTTRLCTNQRVVRFPVPQKIGYTAHFKLLSLVSGGRDAGSFSFELAALREHIGFYLSFASKLSASDFAVKEISVELSDTNVVSHLCSVFEIDRDQIRASVRARDSESAGRLLENYSVNWPKTVNELLEDPAQYKLPQHLLMQLRLVEENVCIPLTAQHERVSFNFNLRRLTGLGYYQGPCFHIKMTNDRGETYMLADGGFVDWTKRLLADSKERLLTSAIGTELLCRQFGRSQTLG